MDSMTQEEFLEKYKGKFIEVTGYEVAWLFEVDSADFSKGNDNFLGWVGARNIILGVPGVIEKYEEENSETAIVLRQEDKITVCESREELEKRIFDYAKENLLKYEKRTGD